MRGGMEKLVLHLEIKKRIREGRWLKKQNLIELEEDYNHLRREISRGRMRNPSSSSSPIEHAKTNTKTPCCSKVGLKRGPWTPEEDELLSNYIKREGEGRWRTLPKNAGLLRCGKSCRLRWMNYLRPSVKRGQIAPDEEDLILRLHRLLGNRWSLIAGRIPGRTDNEIKNYWNTHLSKKLISQGIDPRTHRPLNPDSSPDAIKAPSSSPSKANNNLSPLSPDIARSDSTPLSDPKPPAKTNANGQLGSREGNAYFPSNLIDHHHHQFQTETVLVGYETLPTSANGVLMATLRNNNGGTNDEDEDINYCSEDVFSSFLNSLIDEDALGNHHQTLQQLQLHGIAAVPPEPLINLGFAWDQSTLISQPSNQHMDRTQEPQ